ncbi:Clp1/GlmU family protein [Candidatus Caldatribacterium sp.]|uniref:Clp1/GlmU family protein n=1 Tax=Candidatus Caldatribacterium sp. TaxID=2282143 RepID=UPI0029940CE5|nr:Clp1/GlmU family protein [Candidatus Caldatribacterium sp.]MDW8080426.1 Clp1/GlmU family protein [Candidatus Calescibacterium sp.]
MERLSWPREWAFLEEALGDFRGTIIVIAPSDRGKTTLVRLLVHTFLKKGKRVGWVDTDPGQSCIGPPTTLGASVLLGHVDPKDLLFTPYFRFFGDTTPERDIVAFAYLTWDLVRVVKRRSDVTLVDTCGLFHSPLGYYLKTMKIRLIDPEVVLALGEEEEFAPFVPFLKERLLVLSVPSEVAKKCYETRREHRRQLFSLYFSSGKMMCFPLTALRFSLPCYPSFFLWKAEEVSGGIRFTSLGEEVFLSSQDEEIGVICGLYTSDGRELGLGILERVLWKDGLISVFGVQCVPGKVEAIVPGVLRVDRSGEERGRLNTCPPPFRFFRFPRQAL